MQYLSMVHVNVDSQNTKVATLNGKCWHCKRECSFDELCFTWSSKDVTFTQCVEENVFYDAEAMFSVKSNQMHFIAFEIICLRQLRMIISIEEHSNKKVNNCSLKT